MSDGLLGLAEGIKGFAGGMMDAEDRRYKRMEMEAKAKAQEEDKQRQRFMDTLTLRSRGFTVPEGDIYEMNPQDMQLDESLFPQPKQVVPTQGLVPRGKLAPQRGLVAGKPVAPAKVAPGAPVPQAGAPTDVKSMKEELVRMDLTKKQAEQEDRERAKTPAGKVEKLDGTQRKRFDDVTGAYDAALDIEAAYNAQPRDSVFGNTDMLKIPFRGGTDFTVASNLFGEFIGRLQTGAVISKDEASSFMELRPEVNDDPKIAKLKLDELKFRLGARLKGFGIDEEGARFAGFLKPRGQAAPPPPAVPQQASVPEAGMVEDGHEFLGGDPADPKSWRKVDIKAAGAR